MSLQQLEYATQSNRGGYARLLNFLAIHGHVDFNEPENEENAQIKRILRVRDDPRAYAFI